MKRPLLYSAAAVALLSASLFAADAIDLTGVKCVMNPRANAKAAKVLDYKGGKVFFCCDNCPKGFTAKIAAGDKVVAAKGNAQLVATKQVEQHKCPISGRALDSSHSLDVASAKIVFCCPNCKGKVAGLEGDEQLLAAFGDGAYKKAAFKIKKKTAE